MILSKPAGLQRRSIVSSTRRLNIWDGSVRSGKTVGSIIRWLHYVASGPEGELLMGGRTERTLKRNVLDQIAEIVGPGEFKVRSGYGEAVILGRRVYLHGANDERSEAKLRGLTLAGAYCDELTTWYPDVFGMLLSRLSVPGAKLFATTNPDSPNHWLMLDYLSRPELDLVHFKFRLDDNPNLDPAYVEEIKREYVGVWYRRYILGEWVEAEGAIYDAWTGKPYVVEDVPAMQLHWCANDYGRSNPFCMLLFGLGIDGRVYVISELWWDGKREHRQKSDAEYVADYRGWMATFGEDVRPEWIFVPPDARSFLNQLWADGVQGAAEADNTVNDGIRLVATALSQDRLRVHSSCTNLIAEFPAYAWDPKAALRGEDKPLKVNDHAIDALRYGLMGMRHVWPRAELKQLAPQ